MATGAPALETICPSTVTRPARINARARSRVGASPRSTSIRSSRVLLIGTSIRHKGLLALTRDNPLRDRAQLPLAQLRVGERLSGAGEAFRRQRPRSIEPQQ